MPTYTFQQISYPGTNSAGGETRVQGVNDAGVLAGTALPPTGEVFAFTYQDGRFTALPTYSGFTDLNGESVSNSGTVLVSGSRFGDALAYGNYTVTNGVAAAVPGQVAGDFLATITNSGAYVGAHTAEYDSRTQSYPSVGVVIANGQRSTYLSPGAISPQTSTLQLFGGNANGYAVGNYGTFTSDTSFIPVLLNTRTGAFTTINVPGASGYIRPLAINDANQIFGSYFTYTNNSDTFDSHYFLESNGIYYQIDFPNDNNDPDGYNDFGDTGDQFAAINNKGQIVRVNYSPEAYVATPGARTDDRAPVAPLNNVLLPVAVGPETVTVSYAAANGVLAGGGFVQTAPGVYAVLAPTVAAAQADVRALVFTPTFHQVGPGQSVTTAFTLTVSNGGAPLSDDSSTAIAASTDTPPVITGATAGQSGAPGAPVHVFASVAVADPNPNLNETVTVSFAATAGVLSGGGFVQTAPGVYSFTAPGGGAGAGATAQAALRAAVFTPAAGQGLTVLTITVNDGLASASDSTTSVGPGGYLPPVTDPLQTEFQNLARALVGGTDVNTPSSPISTAVLAFQALDSQYTHGQVSLAQAETTLQHMMDGTTAVAVADYAFFTGYTPTAQGLNYLVHSATNATDLNDPYYAGFSTENRYINFAVNLATGPGAGASAFQSTYGALSLADATAKAYAAVFGATADAAKVSALLTTLVPDGLGGQETRAQYFGQYGGDGPNGQGTKAAMIGFLLSQAVHDGSGVYGSATEHYLAALAHGQAPAFGSELALTYGANVNLVGITPTPDPTITG